MRIYRFRQEKNRFVNEIQGGIENRVEKLINPVYLYEKKENRGIHFYESEKKGHDMPENPQSSVLVVDDNSKNLQVLADILRGKNLRVATAKSGIKALKFIEKIKPDIILLDIMMPEMDGFEVCRQLHENEETRDIPIIFISALADTDDKLKGFESGGVDYITKPFHKEEVFARIHTHLKLKWAQEEQKRTNQLLRAANVTKDKLFSIVAHDLRGPISSLSAMLDLLIDEPECFDEYEKTFLLKNLQESVKNTGYLLENLLSWARSQKGDIKFHPEQIDLTELVEKNIRLFSNKTKEKSIQLRSSMESPVYVFADENTVMIVLRNLISNSLKFTPELGEINISARLREDVAEIRIQDTGVGISRENITKLFKEDFHFTTHGTNKEKGSGLGLILCREFIENNGGKIWVESEPGKGSTFKFVLPRTASDKKLMGDHNHE